MKFQHSDPFLFSVAPGFQLPQGDQIDPSPRIGDCNMGHVQDLVELLVTLHIVIIIIMHNCAMVSLKQSLRDIFSVNIHHIQSCRYPNTQIWFTSFSLQRKHAHTDTCLVSPLMFHPYIKSSAPLQLTCNIISFFTCNPMSSITCIANNIVCAAYTAPINSPSAILNDILGCILLY